MMRILLSALAVLLLGCSKYDNQPPQPPETPAAIDAAHYQSSKFTLDGRDPSAGTLTIKSQATVKVRGEVLLAAGKGRNDFMDGTVSLVRAADNDAGEEVVDYAFLKAVKEPTPGVLLLEADWTPNAPPGQYELRMTSCPLGGLRLEFPQTVIARSVVDVVQ
jgi:hypothetical protein